MTDGSYVNNAVYSVRNERFGLALEGHKGKDEFFTSMRKRVTCQVLQSVCVTVSSRCFELFSLTFFWLLLTLLRCFNRSAALGECLPRHSSEYSLLKSFHTPRISFNRRLGGTQASPIPLQSSAVVLKQGFSIFQTHLFCEDQDYKQNSITNIFSFF